MEERRSEHPGRVEAGGLLWFGEFESRTPHGAFFHWHPTSVPGWKREAGPGRVDDVGLSGVVPSSPTHPPGFPDRSHSWNGLVERMDWLANEVTDLIHGMHGIPDVDLSSERPWA